MPRTPVIRPRSSASAESTAALVQEVELLIEKIEALIGASISLTGKDKIRSTKLRKGGIKVIPTIAALATQFELAIPGHPIAQMLAQRKLALDLVPLQSRLVIALKRVDDAIFLSNSQSFASASMHYVVLRRLARASGSLEKALEPTRVFFARRGLKGKDVAATEEGAAATPAKSATKAGRSKAKA